MFEFIINNNENPDKMILKLIIIMYYNKGIMYYNKGIKNEFSKKRRSIKSKHK